MSQCQTMSAYPFQHGIYGGGVPFQPYTGAGEADARRATDEPTHTDVLLGRGVATNRHPGNIHFRAIVSKHVDVYVISTKKQKMTISRSIVDHVRTQLHPPGRFLEKHAQTGLWQEVDDKRALEKTAQALRDGAAPLRKQLAEDTQDPSFLNGVFEGTAGGNASMKSASHAKNGKRGHNRMISMSSVDVMPSSTSDVPPPRKKHHSDPQVSQNATQTVIPQPNAHWPPLYSQLHAQSAAMPNAAPSEPRQLGLGGDQYLGQAPAMALAPVQVDARHAFFDPSATATNVLAGYSLNDETFSNEDLLKMALLLGGNL